MNDGVDTENNLSNIRVENAADIIFTIVGESLNNGIMRDCSRLKEDVDFSAIYLAENNALTEKSAA